MKNQSGNRGNNESTRSSWNYETSRLLKKNVTLAVAEHDLFLRRLHEPRLQWGDLSAVNSDAERCLTKASVHTLDSVGTLRPVRTAAADAARKILKARKPRSQVSAELQRSIPTAMLRPVNSAKVTVCAYSFANASSFATASCTFPYTSQLE
jgi:hypothetical protein